MTTTPNPAPHPGSCGRYTDEHGVDHDVVCERVADHFWRVVDISPEGERLIEQLGPDDDEQEALTLARDYLAQVQRFLEGARDEQVLADPRPRRAAAPNIAA